MDSSLLLAVVIDANWLVATVVTALLGSGGGVKLLWNHWTKREEDKRDTWKKVVEDKDDLIKKKDQRIEDLSKELSRKSDEHAEKIEQLMGMAIDKVEGMGSKIEGLLDRALNVQSEFTVEVRRLNLEQENEA